MTRTLAAVGALVMLLAMSGPAGCLRPPHRQTPVAPRRIAESPAGRGYWLYVPSDYSPDRAWPLVITLHGDDLWDSSRLQIREWRFLAEQRGLIVVAPDLQSSSFWSPGNDTEDLSGDERAVLAIMDEVMRNYRISPQAVLLTGFLEGGYPLYYIGLRNAGRLSMLIARDCYFDEESIAAVRAVPEARELPMVVFNGKDGWLGTIKHGWAAFAAIRNKGCFKAVRKEVRGAQRRRPAKAYEYWVRHQLPASLRR